MNTFHNPVIPGFYPDPSLCRVGDDYYLATSTFEYFPGVPVFHSRDLVHWRQIGHCLTSESQVPLHKCRPSGGIYAPTLRHHGGRFYMVTSNVTGGGSFYVHADDPAGPWSQPVWVHAPGGDPDLFFDDDGTAWYTDCGRLGVWQFRIDIASGKPLEKSRHIWAGTGGRWPEAPHIYKIGGRYFLMISEGGTEFGHYVSIARSDSPGGPWESCPYNSILTHAQRPHEIQATGHADLVQIPDGSWWAVFLGIRHASGPWQHLGRETFLAPVHWTADGWPVIGGKAELLDDFCLSRRTRQAMPIRNPAAYETGCVIPPGAPGTVDVEMPAPALPPHPWPAEPARDDFDSPTLGMQWNFLRNPYPRDWSLTARPGWLRLNGSAVTLNDDDSPAWVGRRQQHFDVTATTLLDFNPQAEHEEAGLTVMMNATHHYEIAVIGEPRRVIIRRRIGDLSAIVTQATIDTGPIELRITAAPLEYAFSYRLPSWPANENLSGKTGTDTAANNAASQSPVFRIGSKWRELARGATRYLSAEVAGGFTGVYMAMYATGNGHACASPADFDWFEYRPAE